jgi:hypothetical protein
VCLSVNFEEQEIRRLLEAEPLLLHKARYQIIDVDPPVDELSGHRHFFPVLDIVALDVADLGQTRHDARAVGVPEAPLDIDIRIVCFVDHNAPLDLGGAPVQKFANFFRSSGRHFSLPYSL